MNTTPEILIGNFRWTILKPNGHPFIVRYLCTHPQSLYSQPSFLCLEEPEGQSWVSCHENVRISWVDKDNPRLGLPVVI